MLAFYMSMDSAPSTVIRAERSFGLDRPKGVTFTPLGVLAIYPVNVE